LPHQKEDLIINNYHNEEQQPKERRAWTIRGVKDFHNGKFEPYSRTTYINQLEAMNKAMDNKRKKDELKEYFTFYNIQNYVHITQMNIKLSKSDLARLIYLSSFSNYTEGMLVYDNSVPIQEKDLPKVLNTSPVTTKRFKKNLTELGILRFENNKIYVSTGFVFKGRSAEKVKHYSRMFNNSIRDLYENSNISSLALIYQILPYISFWHNVLCRNPKTKNTPINPLNWNDLCSILGIKNPSELKKKLKEYRFSNGEHILKTGTLGDDTLIYINPRIVYKNNDSDIFKTVYALFCIGDTYQSDEKLLTL